MAGCSQWFWAEDQDGNNLPFDAIIGLWVKVGDEYDFVGQYEVGVSGLNLTLQSGVAYKYKAILPVGYGDDWLRPADRSFTACSSDFTLVYKKIICTAGAKKCVGDDVYVCSSEGTEWRFSKNCPNGCSEGECIPAGPKGAYTYKRYPDENCKTGSHMYIDRLLVSGDTTYTKTIYLEFGIKDVTTVASAILKLHLIVNMAGALTAKFKRITGSWTEGTITWNNHPAVTDSNSYDYELTFDEFNEFDITKLVTDAIANGESVIGVEISSTNDTFRGYESKEFGGTDPHPPELVVTTTAPPTISSISWTPTGDYVTLSSGTTLLGDSEDLKVASMDPAHSDIDQGEAMLALVDKDGTETSTFTVAAGDHFRFDNKEWWAQNIICGPECDLITLADEVAQFEKIPKIGDEIQFAAAIDWHGQELFRIRWYYAKSLNRCFSDITDLDWNEFAVGENTNMPAHTFDTEGDEAITFFRVTATNIDGATGEIDTLCGPIFNLWKYKPSWWDHLLEAIRTVNAEDIAHPIVMLSENVAATPGWTKPPFECPICNQVFDGEDSELPYAKHLMSHITAFEYGWFGK